MREEIPTAVPTIIQVRAGSLRAGDVMSTNGATVNLAVVHAHGDRVYIDATFEDGVVRCETIPADTPIHLYVGEEN